MSIRIGAFFQHLPPFPGAGSLRATSIISGLMRDDLNGAVKTTLFTPTASPEILPEVDVVHVRVADVENAHGIVGRIWGEVRMGLAAARLIIGRARDLDMLIISTPAYLTALIISTFARLRRLPYVIELRDIYPQVYAESGLLTRRSLPYRLLSWASRMMYLNSKLTLTATNGLKNGVLADAPAAKVQCVYNGFPHSFVNVDVPKKPRFTVCFHGILGYFQNLTGIIELAGILQPHDIDVLVIGYGKQSYLAEQCTLDNFIFRGKLSFSETIEQVASCHVGLCLRNDDDISRNAFPVKVWEYLGLAIPCIVTPHCEAGIFLEKSRCGFQFETREINVIAEKIVHLKNNAQVMAALSNSCAEQRLDYTRERLGRVAADTIIEAARDIQS